MNTDHGTPIDEEAVAWFVLLRDEAATGEDRARFAAWLEVDIRHRKAWGEVERLWTGMGALHAGEMRVRPSYPRRRGGAWRAGQGERRTWQKAAAIAAALFLMVAIAGFWTYQPGLATALLADYRTGPGGQTTVALPDGSEVTLGAASALSVAFDASSRKVVLHRGEGFFAVMRNPDRPFVVEAGPGRITVVGTAFDVRRAGDRVGVSVASGVVDVASRPEAVRLTAGKSVRYDAAGHGKVRRIDIADIGGWRDDRLVFRSAPLADVLGDLERYRRGRILLLGDALAGLTVTGVFDTRRTDAALETIGRTLPVRIVRLTGLLVLVLPAG